MKKEKLTEISTEELKQREKINISIFVVFLGVYFFMIGVIIYSVFKNGLTALALVPFAFLPISFILYRNLKVIKKEIKSRSN